MNVDTAMHVFGKAYPKLIITRVIDYDKRHFVIEAVENMKSPDYGGSFYGVDKKTKEVTGFFPSLDIEAFFDAMENRTKHSILAE